MVTINVPPRTGNYGPEDDGAAGVLKIGEDQNIKSISIPSASVAVVVPRDTAVIPNPLKVVLPNVAPGNYVEVEWCVSFTPNPDVADTFPALTAFQVALSFDGSTAFPGTFSYVNNSAGGSNMDGATDVQSASGRALVKVPDGPTPGAVRTVTALLICTTSTSGIAIVGTDLGPIEGFSAVNLKVSEIGAAIVAQAGPGALVPVV